MSGAGAAVKGIVDDPVKALKDPGFLINPLIKPQIDIAKGIGKDIGLLPDVPKPLAPGKAPGASEALAGLEASRKKLAGRFGRAATIKTQAKTRLGGSSIERPTLLGG